MEAGCPLESRVEERRTAARAGGMLERWLWEFWGIGARAPEGGIR